MNTNIENAVAAVNAAVSYLKTQIEEKYLGKTALYRFEEELWSFKVGSILLSASEQSFNEDTDSSEFESTKNLEVTFLIEDPEDYDNIFTVEIRDLDEVKIITVA
jgi:hypothetical protein